jgi:hemoglobin
VAEAGSLYEAVGGDAFFDRLVARFYEGVAADDVLRPLYPDDLDPPRRHLTAFLVQYWGGPDRYDRERGAPRLRLRHVPFAIGAEERDRWLAHMREAIADLDPPPEVVAALEEYFGMAAEALRNVGPDR